MIEKKELSEGKQKLLTLEKEGKVVFHGSPTPDLEELEPRQGHTVPKGRKDLIKDGDPAISATPYAEIAIFRALIRKGTSDFSAYKNGKLGFRANREALDAAEERGYVYVLERGNFSSRTSDPSHMEWRSKERVRPIDVVVVQTGDLPKEIEILKEPQY